MMPSRKDEDCAYNSVVVIFELPNFGHQIGTNELIFIFPDFRDESFYSVWTPWSPRNSGSQYLRIGVIGSKLVGSGDTALWE